MLKKMRWRFILSAMGATFVVVAVLIFMINISSYKVATDRLDRMLNHIVENENRNKRPFDDDILKNEFSDKFSPETAYSTRYFSLEIKDNKIIAVKMDFIASVSKEEALEYANFVVKKGKTSGFYGDYRYIMKQNGETKSIVFLNSANEIQFMKTLFWVSVFIGAISLLAVFGLVFLFSKKAIEPYIKNIELQKQFITDAGHEIKTPLTSISTSADVLEMEYGKNEWLDNINNQTARLKKLVANMVALSRLDEDMPLYDKSEFSASDAIWEATEPFTVLAKAKGKVLDLNIEDGLNVIGDENSFRQMISVLLDNAVKYSDENGIIKLSAYAKKKKVIIEVFNTCKLSDFSDLDRLFDRFYRPDSSRDSATGGSGIGLSIAKATAEAHGGKISVKSEDGKSISFKIEL